MDTHITVAIDGPSGAGKSTIARAAARRFGLIYVDTGAIYRTVGLAGERAGVNCSDADAMQALLPTLRIELVYDAAGEQRMLLNGEDVSETIRLPEVSLLASRVSALPVVRAFLLDMQRSLALVADLPLPDETTVYPGHESFTTLGQERRSNPYLMGEVF